MLRIAGVAVLAMALISGVAVAADDDFVMGNYAGAFKAGAFDGKSIRAQVATKGVARWRVVLYVGVDGKEEVRAEVKGRSRAGTGKVGPDGDKVKAAKSVICDFSGTADFGAMGGVCEVKGSIAKEVMQATIKGKDGAADIELKRVFLEPPTRGMKAPEGALVLLGEGNADAWNLIPHWQLQGDGSIRTAHSNLVSKESFGDAHYHIEFRCPFMPAETGQARGNSGVYVMGRYEVQVLDSFADLPKDNLCGGIYKKAVPSVPFTACLPPLQWQTYDITFTAPKYDASGAKTSDARITALHNGITIHDDVVLPSPTPGGVSGEEAPVGPLMFQDHGDPVQFRNVWVKKLN